MSGLISNTKITDHTSKARWFPKPSRLSLSHRAIKNKTRKKSLRGLSLDTNCIRNGEVANDIPASKHQISKLNQTSWNKVHKIRHHPIPISRRNSSLFISRFTSFGKTYLANTTTNIMRSIHSTNITPHQSPCHHRIAIHIITSITTISCTIRIQIEIFPWIVWSSSLSHRSFTITIVLEKVNHIARNKLVGISYPITNDIIYAIPTLAKIWIHHTHSATFPCSFITLILSSTQTINNNNAIPKWENNSKKLCPSEEASTNPNTSGHTITPANKYQINNGCLNIFIVPAIMITTTKITDNWARSDEWRSW